MPGTQFTTDAQGRIIRNPMLNPNPLASVLGTPDPQTDDSGQDAQQGSGLDGLAALLQGAYKSPADSAPRFAPGTGTNRNPGEVAALSKQYGVPNEGNVSQQDLEALDQMVRGANVNDKLAETMPPEILRAQTQADTEAARNKSALDVENLRGQYGMQTEAQRAQSAQDIEAQKAAAAGAAAGPLGKNTPLGQQERGILEMASSVNKIGSPLLNEYEQQYPGISQNPDQYGHSSDIIMSMLEKGYYAAGGTGSDIPMAKLIGGNSANDPILQKAASIQILATRALMMGRVNQQVYNDIMMHLPRAGYSPGANYQRLQTLLTSILPSQVSSISAGHADIQPDALLKAAGFPTQQQ